MLKITPQLIVSPCKYKIYGLLSENAGVYTRCKLFYHMDSDLTHERSLNSRDLAHSKNGVKPQKFKPKSTLSLIENSRLSKKRESHPFVTVFVTV